MRSGHEAFTIAASPNCRQGQSLIGPFRTLGRWLLVLGIGVMLAGSTGCSAFQGLRSNLQYNDSVNDFVMGWRNSVWARQAWHEHKQEFVGEPHYVSFGQGFRDGYAAVAGGGNGCVPALPPRSFWTWKYQTAEGQGKIAAWYAGYPYGAKVAQEDGAGNFQQIQVSHLIEAQYSPEFKAGFCPGCSPENSPQGFLPPGAIPVEEGQQSDATPTPAPSAVQGSAPTTEWPAEVPLPGASTQGVPGPVAPPGIPAASSGAQLWPSGGPPSLAQFGT